MPLSALIHPTINKRKNLGWREGCQTVVCSVSLKESDGTPPTSLIVYIEIDLRY